jgi:hypothetical protein
MPASVGPKLTVGDVSDFHITRLEVSMSDAFFVRYFQRFRDLARNA